MDARVGPHRVWARRVPAVLQGLVGLALLLALAPSALHLPITGPNGQAEVAPVPGRTQGQASLSLLGAATSSGVGSGGAGALANGFVPATSGGDVLKPSNFPCIGNPPRQTEDPLSPPCVTGWTGDNGGMTYQGVTGQAIKVFLHDTSFPSGLDLNQPIGAADRPRVRTAKTLLRYFQSRFETYGRTVQVVADTDQDFGNEGAAQAAEFGSQDAAGDVSAHPLAVINPAVEYTSPSFFAATSRAGVVGFAGWPLNFFSNGFTEVQLEQERPYLYSFVQPLEQREQETAQFVCSELNGRTVTHSAEYSGQKRKFGILYGQNSYEDVSASASVLRSDLMDTCSLSVGSDYAPNQGSSRTRFQVDGVTTVICVCGIDAPGYSGSSTDSPTYGPEYVFDANNGDDEQSTMRMSDNGTTAYPAHSFNGALALDWRWKIPATPDTYWAQAYTAVNSDGQFDKYTGPPLYETLMQLFGAIQMAGPHLTPTSIQQGMLKWQRAEIGLTSPLAGTALGAPWFVQDEVLLRWNSTEVTPGGGDSASGATGCYDVIGPRSALGAWPQGDQSTDPGSCGADWSSYSAGVSGGQPPNS